MLTDHEIKVISYYKLTGSTKQTSMRYGVNPSDVIRLSNKLENLPKLKSKYARSDIDNEEILNKYLSKNLTINYGNTNQTGS